MVDVSEPLSWVEEAAVLDRVAQPLSRWARKAIPRGAVRDLLHGVPLGHPLHPALVLAPGGAFLSAGVLEFVPGQRRAVRVLVITGLASSVPAALAGLADWSELHEQQQRVGLLHAASNAVGLVAYSSSLLQGAAGQDGRARRRRMLGLAAMSLGGFIGGHLSYRQAAGANHGEAIPHILEPGWHDLGPLDDFVGGNSRRVLVGGVPLVVIRGGSTVHVLADQCPHLAGPLSEGRLVRSASGQMCVECPWHGSRFAVDDGRVTRGPATAAAAVLETLVADGHVSARLPGAG